MNKPQTEPNLQHHNSSLGGQKNERKFESPAAWLLGRQMLGSIKGILLYIAYGKKLDPRDWMWPRVFPSGEKSEALKFWRKRFKSDPPAAQQSATATQSDRTEEILKEETKFWQDKKEFWFDYISDTGDGGKATYSIAYLCLSNLYVNSRDPEKLAADGSVKTVNDRQATTDHDVLPRGEFLFIGGDTAYHVSDYMTLANHVQGPFQWAHEDLVEDGGILEEDPNRPIFGIPGNHDYYDQLDGFRRQFRHSVREDPPQGRPPENEDNSKKPQLFLPGFNRHQEASYVALHLPFDWWLWGLDTEVGQVDERQQKFFRDLCKDPAHTEAFTPPQKLIVATCAPTTVFGKLADPNDKKSADAFGQLGLSQPFLPEKRDDGTYDLNASGDAKIEPGQCRLDISGDVHHYARYWGPKPITGERPRKRAKTAAPAADSYASVVSGIGGAFHHPSETYLDEVQEQTLYPSEKDSTGEVARRIFRFWNIWNGGYVWLAGFIMAFALYFASTVPQSSKQVINNFAPMGWLDLVPKGEQSKPITPTAMPLPSRPEEYSNSLVNAVTTAANAPITTLWGEVHILKSACDPQLQRKQNPNLYFFGPCRAQWTWDFTIGLLLFLFSPVPLVVALLSNKLFGTTPQSSLGAEAKPSQEQKTPSGTQIKPKANAPHADPDKKLWAIAVASMLMFIAGLVMIKPYREHITPFGSSMTILYAIVWAGAALTLSLQYSEFLFKKAHWTNVHLYDWALTWVLTISGLASIAFGLWVFGRNNLPALLVSDMVFMLLFAGGILGVIILPFGVGAELLQPHGKVVKVAGKLLIGIWHIILQIAVPFLLIRKGSVLAWIVAAALVILMSLVGKSLLAGGRRAGLVFSWLIFGALMLALPYLFNYLVQLPAALPAEKWNSWWGLVPSLIAGVAGAVMSCVWFGWYLGVCFVFNGHNNEVGGASRIEEFKQFIRFRLTEDGLTGYVIAIDEPQKQGRNLKPRIVDVFHLRVKPATGTGA